MRPITLETESDTRLPYFDGAKFVVGPPGYRHVLPAIFLALWEPRAPMPHFLVLTAHPDGIRLVLDVLEGFASDGTSPPAYNRKTNKRGAVGVHDPIYKLIRWGVFPESLRTHADALLETVWPEDGMWGWLARTEAWVLKRWASSAADPANRRKLKWAPR